MLKKNNYNEKTEKKNYHRKRIIKWTPLVKYDSISKELVINEMVKRKYINKIELH